MQLLPGEAKAPFRVHLVVIADRAVASNLSAFIAADT